MNGDISLYFHIPFCTKKCPYCHFYVVANKEPFKDALLAGFQNEWQSIRDKITPHKLVSIYFGGGTPSLFGARRLEAVLKTISAPSDIEITIEANPDGLTKEMLCDFRSLGINRLSLGVQSFEEEKLVTLGRTHTAYKAQDAVFMAFDSRFTNISIDLMYELPRQTVAGWQSSLTAALELPITHLSLYNLTIEPHTGFFRRQNELTPLLPSDEDASRMYTDAIDCLTNAGFRHYEISAFCKDNLYSRHNIGYWTGRAFWGLGPSAFSYFDGKRFQNICNLQRYIALLEEKKSPIDFVDDVSSDDRRKELLAVGLRMLEGIVLPEFEARYGPLELETNKACNKLVELGLLQQANDTLSLTKKGILFYDTIASELI
jgi:oxygen-independent coproporphyrinogen-3 oxidase